MNPHNFRHSRATYLANFLTEAQMKEYFGWQQDSKMAGVHVHLSGRDVDNALLRVYGIENKNEKKESIFNRRNVLDANRLIRRQIVFVRDAGYRLTRKPGRR